MSSVPTITNGSITHMTGLANRPVYFLHLNNSPKPILVVKGEAAAGVSMSEKDTTVSVKWGSKIMKNVNNKLVNTKIMTNPEIAIFKAFATQAFNDGTKQKTNAGRPYKWVKMPMVAGLSDAEFYADNNKPIPGKIKKSIQGLLSDSVWSELGKVVAVDIFNGNSDRFDISSGFWQNKGNVMFLTGGQTSVIGLDTFDPNAQQKGNLASGGGFDELNILINPVNRKTFAQQCTQSVGHELRRGLTANDIQSFKVAVEGVSSGVASIKTDDVENLFLPYADLFATGLSDGAAKLKIYLQGKVRQYAAARPSQPPNRPPPMPPGIRTTPRGTVIPNRPPPVPPRPATRTTARGTVIPNRPAPSLPGKTVPQGVLDRMEYLGWSV